MSHTDKRPADDYQAIAERKYAALKKAVDDSGYFALDVIGTAEYDQIVCASKYQEGYGYTGRTALVTEKSGNWYLVTPHPYHYRVVDSNRVKQAVIAFLGESRIDAGKATKGVCEVREDLVEISYEEFQQALGKR